MDLSDLKLDHKPKKKSWEWIPILGAWNGTILGVDQSIANVGWAFIRVYNGQKPMLLGTGHITTDRITTGHEDTLLRGDRLVTAFRELIDYYAPGLVVHEHPPVSGTRGAAMRMRPEFSLVAAMALRSVCVLRGVPVRIVQGQKMKKRLTGVAGADKAMIKRFLERNYPSLIGHKPNNEHTRDAFGLAVVASEEAK